MEIDKPCYEIGYCPYGALVEQFPTTPVPRAEKEEHNEYLKRILEAGKFDNGEEIDDARKAVFEEMINDDISEFPEEVDDDKYCKLWGHLCPVYECAIEATEKDAIPGLYIHQG